LELLLLSQVDNLVVVISNRCPKAGFTPIFHDYNRKLHEAPTEDPTPVWKRRRYFLVLMSFFGLFNVIALRVNLSVAIVVMTEIRTIEHPDGTQTVEQYFPWSSVQKGYILSSFLYGYLMTQVSTSTI
jgi:hypothetical protein